MDWLFDGTSIVRIPEYHFGFIYKITYTDGSAYIGKKQVRSENTIPALKSGEVRPGAKRVHRNILRKEDGSIIVSKKDRKEARKLGLKAKREAFDVVVSQANWKAYEGSCEDVGDRVIESKEILLFCDTKKELSYREEEALFFFCVLEDDTYLNNNIGGRYFKDDL